VYNQWKAPVMKRWIALLFITLLCAFPLAAQDKETAPPADRDLRVHFVDVGQGDCILIQTPDGMTMLIDGGWDDGKAFAYLESQAITEVDVMVASHPHADHIGGLIDVMRAVPVGEIWTSGAVHTTDTFEIFLDTIAAERIPYYEVEPGTTIRLGDLQLVVLYGNPTAPDLNDASLVLQLHYGSVSFLFTDDAGASAEIAMLRTVRDQLPSTILKVGHHGSYTSSGPDFLAAVQPDVAVYSAGADNPYGHPHPVTIDNLMAVGAIIYGTDIHGTVVVSTDGETYNVQTTRDAPPVRRDLVDTPEPTAQAPTLRYDPNGSDVDCGDFATHAEAQEFFLAAGGPDSDRHRLDGDHDGVACESLP
jgi:competence protein ComEC